MCTHQKVIRNKYTGKWLMVKCGKCHACQLEKANAHFNRIMNHEKDARYFRLFITLNYSNQSLPYLDMSDSMETDADGMVTLPVYRDCRIYHYRNRTMKRSRLIVDDTPYQQIGRFTFDPRKVANYDGLKEPQKFGKSSCVGICWSKDFSDFIKRLKQNLLRFYNIDTSYGKLQYYKVSEYGPTTGRPHFHAILYFPIEYKGHYQAIKRAIVSSWPFCSLRQLQKNVTIAQTAQQYCALYDVRPTDYPVFLQIRKIAQKPSFTRNFGFGERQFISTSLLEKIRHHDIQYITHSRSEDGAPILLTLPVPQYVMSRFFPKFKGMHLLDAGEVSRVLAFPLRLRALSTYLGLSEDEVKSNIRKIQTAQRRFGHYGFEYATLWFRQSSIRASQSLMRHMLSITDESDRYQLYDFVYDDLHRALVATDVNNFPVNLRKDEVAQEKWNKRCKKIKLNDYAVKLNFKYVEFKLKPRYYGKYSKTAVS